MRQSIPLSLTCAALAAASLHAQDAAEKITYQDQIRPLLENKCFSCHNPDKKKGDLDLTSFAALMTGGGGGAVVDPGNVDGSRLWTTCAKKEEPFMPPEGAPLSTKDLDLLAAWVKGGLLETKSSIAKKSAKPKVDMAVAVTSGKPTGPIARPEHVLLEPVVVTPRTTAITAMAHSPWTNLAAIAAPKQILLYDTDTRQLVGIFPYTEGYARSLQFSQNGSLLVAGGGRAGKNGHAIVWDVKTGKRIVEVGKEFDQAQAADISPDHKMVAIGCTSKKVKCYDTATGDELYTISKHTEWLLGTKFSPDGVLLATSDRNGNVMVWEAENGGEFYILGQHKAACGALAWRADSNLLASGGMDGSVMIWEMNEGKKVKDWAAHTGGVQSVAFTPDGKVVSSGNDGLIRVWDINGTKLAEAASQGDIVTKVIASADNKTAISANWRGEIIQWNLTAGAALSELGRYISNPSPIAQRIVQAEQRMAELTTKIPSLTEAIKKAETDAKARDEALAKLRAEVAENDRRSKAYPGEIANEEKALAALKATLDKAIADHKARVAAIKAHAERATKLAALEKELAPIAAEAAKLPAADKAVADATAALAPAPADAALQAKLAAAKAAQQKIAPIKAKADQLTAAVAKAKAELGAAPAPVADLDKIIAETTPKIKTAAEQLAAKKAELPKLPALVKAGPDRIKNGENNVTAGKTALATAQFTLKATQDEIGVLQKVPTALKAAQFNTAVLAEKEALTKLETDFNDFTEAKKDAEAAKVAAAQRITDSKKAIADAAAAQPALDAALKKVQDIATAAETTIKPIREADAAAKAKVDEQKTIIATKQAEIAAATKTKDEAIAAAKKAAEDISKVIAEKRNALAQVSTKLNAPEQVVTAKKAVVAQKEAAVAATKKAVADLTAALPAKEKAAKDAEPTVPKISAEVAPAEKALADAQATKDAAKIAEAQKALDAKKAASAAAQKVLADARAAAAKTKADLAAATNNSKTAEQQLTTAKNEFAAAEKTAAPTRGQRDAIQKEVDAQSKALADKQAAPAAAEKDLAAKVAPLNAAIAAAKTALAPLEAAYAAAHAKLEAEQKTLDTKKAAAATALAAADSNKAKKSTAESTIAGATKEIPEKDKIIAECTAEITKIQPQLEPARKKVKDMTDKYLAMLPK
ncbi:MAG: hypothetical protein IPK32_25055 [Verrucomicrobiaceae bacterium]|nr:hypothetical protein [Verrucomicrobiaceae bacterium]